MPEAEEKEALEWADQMKAINSAYVSAQYGFGVLAADDEYAKALGTDSVNDWAAQHGVETRVLKLAKRVYKRMADHWAILHEWLVPLHYVDLYTRIVPPEDYDKHLHLLTAYCSPKASAPSPPDFIAWLREQYPPKRKQKVTIVRGDNIEYESKEVSDISEVQGEGLVIRGWPIKE